jgi:nicotianamine synthase-like protein/acetyltransferase (GNAT) family protein
MNVAVGTASAKTEKEQVLTSLQQIEKSLRRTAGGSGFLTLQDSILQMEKSVFSFDDDEPGAAALLNEIAPETISDVHEAYRQWQDQLELEFAQRLIQGEAALSDYVLYNRFEELVRRELALVSDTSLQRILFVGNGPLPVSAIHAHLQTGVPVDCVARDEQAFAISAQALEACDLSRAIHVFSSKSQYDLADYNLIVIEIQAEPGRNILKRLRKQWHADCQLLYRTSHGLRKLIHPDTLDANVRGFHARSWQLAQGEQTISTCLLESAKKAAADVQMEWVEEIDSERALQLLHLMNRTLEEETTIGFPGPIDDEAGLRLMRQLNADVIAGCRHVLIAEKDGVVVGQLILTPNSTPNHHHMVELTRGTIDRSFRGGGLALRAFQEVARKCEELGREVICLDVRAGTMAAIWWQHFGFKQYGLLADYSRVGDKKYAGLFLTQTTAELKQRLREIVRSHIRPAPVNESASAFPQSLSAARKEV